MTAIDSLYKIFRVPQTCTNEELHKAFLDRIFEAHPDRNPDQIDQATRLTQTLTSAVTELKDHRATASDGTERTTNNSEVYFTEEINGITLTISIVSTSGVSLRDIKDRQNRFRERWEDLQKNTSDPMCALLLIHAAFEAERFDSVKTLLLNQNLIDLASLLLTNIDNWRACQTLTRWADFLWNAKRGREAVQILEDAIASGRAQITEDGVSRMLPEVMEELRSFHYRWAQYADPTTGIKATPEVRIAHLNRILELGFRFGYILNFLAEAHHDLGDDEQARAYLNQAWEIDPNLFGAVRIGRALGLSKTDRSQEHRAVRGAAPKWTRPSQVPTEQQILEWTKDGSWDVLIGLANPREYSRPILPKARNILRLIATSLGECKGHKRACTALLAMLDFPLYFDIRQAAATSLSKIGDEQTLALMEEFGRLVDEGRSSWSPSTQLSLRNCIDYLRARVNDARLPVSTEQSPDLLIYAKREYEREHYGHARFVLENLLRNISERHPSHLDATVLLAGACAQMNDIRVAIEVIKPVFSELAKQNNRQTMTDIGNWLWQYAIWSEYTEREDDIFKWGLNIELSLMRSAAKPDDFLRPARDMTRWLELLGIGTTAKMLRDLIRTEAPGTLYVDKHDRVNYVRSVTLSEDMRHFLEEFDTRMTVSALRNIGCSPRLNT